MAESLVLERALFVVAPRHCGKSTQLRSMFHDRRFGTDGRVPPSSQKLPETYYLSNNRRLYLRLTSPHEVKETLDDFLGKAKRKMASGRWCFASPLHPDQFENMPNAVETVERFLRYFDSERVRVFLLSPNRLKTDLADFLPGHDLRVKFRRIDRRVEVACIDARQRKANGLLLADFFDFS